METPLDLYMRAFERDDAADEVWRRFQEAARPLVAAGVEVLVPAGGLPALLLGQDGQREVDGAIVLNATAVAAKQTEAAAELRRIAGTAPSRRVTFAKPPRGAVDDLLALARSPAPYVPARAACAASSNESAEPARRPRRASSAPSTLRAAATVCSCTRCSAASRMYPDSSHRRPAAPTRRMALRVVSPPDCECGEPVERDGQAVGRVQLGGERGCAAERRGGRIRVVEAERRRGPG